MQTEETPKIIKYQLGWKFTEDDERFADREIKKSNEYMKNYGKGIMPRMVNFNRYLNTHPVCNNPIPNKEKQ